MKKFNDPVEKGLGRFGEMWGASSLGERVFLIALVAAAALAVKYVILPRLMDAFTTASRLAG